MHIAGWNFQACVASWITWGWKCAKNTTRMVSAIILWTRMQMDADKRVSVPVDTPTCISNCMPSMNTMPKGLFRVLVHFTVSSRFNFKQSDSACKLSNFCETTNWELCHIEPVHWLGCNPKVEWDFSGC